MNNVNWRSLPSELSLNDHEVHICLASVDIAKKEILSLRRFLTDEELARASKFIFEIDRVKYTVARGILREVLGRYLSVDPHSIVFLYNKYGKPCLDERYKNEKISFNLSHSGSMIIYGISKNRKIGIDIEKIHCMDSLDRIVNRYFSSHEKACFEKLSSIEKQKTFFACWTKKEAYIKAHGKGLSYPFDKFSVSMLPGEEAALLCDENHDVFLWTLREIFSTEEYVAAVAVEGRDMDFIFYQWGLDGNMNL
jgi:4'-phosphopantetheinyl transferase